MYQRMQALVKDGTLEQTMNGLSAMGRVRPHSFGRLPLCSTSVMSNGHHAYIDHDAGRCTVLPQDLSGSGGLVSDMDAFSQKLATIVAADYTHAALVSCNSTHPY
jgi:hypothetical protein